MTARGVLALLLALQTTPAAALEVKVWPLFRYARDDARGLVRWSALGPLVEFTGTPETRDFRLRPLLWLQQRRGAVRDDRADILYPLASSRWEERYHAFRLLLFTYRTRPEPGAEGPDGAPPPLDAWTSRMTLLPFVFYGHDADGGTRLSVFPFWLDVDDVLGWTHVRAVMFPLYLRLSEPGVERRWHPFPFVSTVGGELGSGLRLWPFHGDTVIRGREHVRYTLWPFAIRSERLVPGWGWERRRLYLPAYAAIDGAGRTTRSWGLVAHVHTIDTRHGVESIGAPWPFAVRERALGESAYRTWRLFPVYGRSEHRGLASRFYAWPAYRTKAQDADDFHYRRRDVGLLLWRRQRVASERSGRDEELLTVFPALRSERDAERRFGQTPALLDSLLPRNRGVLALWAPLWGIVRWDTRPDGTRDWNVLWGLVAREQGRLRGPWRFARDAGDGG
ncbi:MAG TPA: hypothetical protein VKA21_04790 [Candidatus Binatia bacterium]|nr:hypothetical protein [Candidatus Binatia bacterium]